MGVRSIALSQAFAFDATTPLWETPLAHGAGLIKQLIGFEWGDGVLMNVNFPDCAAAAVTGTRVTRQGQRDAGLAVEERRDTWGDSYYWLNFERRQSRAFNKDTDLEAIAAQAISVSPLHLDMTHHATLATLKAALQGSS
jgi:5'-nucleotidase